MIQRMRRVLPLLLRRRSAGLVFQFTGGNTPWCLEAVQVYTAGSKATEAFTPGSKHTQVFTAGAEAVQVGC